MANTFCFAVGKNNSFQFGLENNSQDVQQWQPLAVQNVKHITDGVAGYCVLVTQDGHVFASGKKQFVFYHIA